MSAPGPLTTPDEVVLMVPAPVGAHGGDAWYVLWRRPDGTRVWTCRVCGMVVARPRPLPSPPGH